MSSPINQHNVCFPPADDSVRHIRNEIAKTKDFLQSCKDFATIGTDEIASGDLMKQLIDKERTLKIEYAKKMHVTKDGKPKEITRNGKCFRTYIDRKTRIGATTVEGLYINKEQVCLLAPNCYKRFYD